MRAVLRGGGETRLPRHVGQVSPCIKDRTKKGAAEGTTSCLGDFSSPLHSPCPPKGAKPPHLIQLNCHFDPPPAERNLLKIGE